MDRRGEVDTLNSTPSTLNPSARKNGGGLFYASQGLVLLSSTTLIRCTGHRSEFSFLLGTLHCSTDHRVDLYFSSDS